MAGSAEKTRRGRHTQPLRSQIHGDAASHLEALLNRPVWPWLLLAGAILYEDEWDASVRQRFRMRVHEPIDREVLMWGEPSHADGIDAQGSAADVDEGDLHVRGRGARDAQEPEVEVPAAPSRRSELKRALAYLAQFAYRDDR